MGIASRARKLMLLAAGLAIAAVALVLVLSGGDPPESEITSLSDARRQLEGAPAPIAALHEQSNQLIDGGADAFEQRLAQLEGHPVVVNKWASWCGPCRAEFPYFQRQVLRHGKRVAFIGVNSTDNDGQAESFLERYPVPYPSYKDPDQKVAAVFDGVAAFPTTAFYDSKGKLQYIKQGGYLEESKLAKDIERYAR
jgi:cytochrome c biogenesis protein CcmG, thiol:disulfide interchange protein DsbE